MIQWNDFSEDNSVADSQSFNIKIWIFSAMVGGGEYLGEFPINLIFFVRAKMGDNSKIWRETGLLASWFTSIYSFLWIRITDSLNI